MKTIEEIRLENLRTLCSQFKSQRQFAIHLEKSSQQLSNWMRIDTSDITANQHTRAISSTAAREIEEKCGKPRGWLDHNHSDFPIKSGDYVFPMIEN